jgi:hypothetical protein
VTLAEVRQREVNLRAADRHLLRARRIAAEHPTWVDRQRGYADVEHARHLQAAYTFYLAAGLGMLAGRIRWLARQRGSVLDAWAKFDRLNAGGCGVT